jgi:hypothetical protein
MERFSEFTEVANLAQIAKPNSTAANSPFLYNEEEIDISERVWAKIADRVKEIARLRDLQNQKPSLPSFVSLHGGKTDLVASRVQQALHAELYCEYFIISGISRDEVLRIMKLTNETERFATVIIPRGRLQDWEALAYHTNSPRFRTEALKSWATIQTTWGHFSITEDGLSKLQQYFSSINTRTKPRASPLRLVA